MKKRKDSFFGMHFDFHAHNNQTGIGEFCDYDTIDELLTKVKPDYIQCDTKGHPGISSYPTNVGYRAPEMKGDILKMWREVTQKHDVALYSHFSGVWDFEAIIRHPDWAAVKIDGTPETRATSVFSPYVDELMIPQLIELAKDWHINGVWVDGDCWGAIVDFSHWAKEKYKKETGLDAPSEDDETGLKEYRNFCRREFFEYVKHYCNEVHKVCPDFQVASNWLYSSYSPGEETIGVDFISGDYAPTNSINSAIFEGRAMQNSTKAWDLMSWGFTTNPYVSKEYEQLCAEAGEVIALGGGFEVYNPQVVGTIEKHHIDKWAKLAEFCRARETTCHKASPVHEGAVILSQKAVYNHKTDLFRWNSKNNYGEDTHGLLFAILDAGYSSELLLSHQVMSMSKEELYQYKFIAIGNLDIIEDEIKEKLINYVKQGGEVIICGPDSTKYFEKELGVRVEVNDDKFEAKIKIKDKSGVLTTKTAKVTAECAEILDYYYTDRYERESDRKVLATYNKYGKGTFVGIYPSYGSYQDAKTTGARDYIEKAISVQYKTKKVIVENTHYAQVVLTTKNGVLTVNLLNHSTPHSNSRVSNFDEILPIMDLKVLIEYPRNPRRVIEMPSGKELEYEYKDGRVVTKLDKLEVHSIITIE